MLRLCLVLVLAVVVSAAEYTIRENPIQVALAASGMKMPKVVRKFTKRTAEVVLDNLGNGLGQIKMVGQEYVSGSSSINARIKKVVPIEGDETDGLKRIGTFVPRGNGAGNPIAEIAAFNLGLVFNQPKLVRPAVRAEMGLKASYQFKKNWEAFLSRRQRLTRNKLKMDNAERVFSTISSTSGHLYGALKAKKEECSALTTMCCRSKFACQTHPIQKLLKAASRQPESGKPLLLNPGVAGDELVLTREFSIVMTIDAILGQWDRYTGTCGNLMFRMSKNGNPHIYSTDNGGANLAGRPSKPSSWVQNQLKYLERFDRFTITRLREMSAFLSGKQRTFIGYSDMLQFVEDFGLYGTMYAPYRHARPAGKLEKFRIALLLGVDSVLKRFDSLVAQHGEAEVYLPEPGASPFNARAAAANGFDIADLSSPDDCVNDVKMFRNTQKALKIGADGIWGNGSQGALNKYEQSKNRGRLPCLTFRAYKTLMARN